MSTKITERDQKLLIFLGVVLLLAAVVMLGIKPGMERSEQLSEQILSAEQQKQEMEDKIAQIPLLQQNNKTGKSKWKKSSSRFYDKMESQQVDRLLTGLVLGQGLDIKLLSLSSEPELAQLMPYEPKNENGEDNQTAMEYSAVWVSSAGFKVTGSKENLVKLVDRLSDEYPAIRVVSYSYGEAQEETEQGTAELSMALEVYMRGMEEEPESEVASESETGETGTQAEETK